LLHIRRVHGRRELPGQDAARVITQNGPSLTFLPSEDVSAWPEELRRKMERGDVAREEEEKEIKPQQNNKPLDWAGVYAGGRISQNLTNPANP